MNQEEIKEEMTRKLIYEQHTRTLLEGMGNDRIGYLDMVSLRQIWGSVAAVLLLGIGVWQFLSWQERSVRSAWVAEVFEVPALSTPRGTLGDDISVNSNLIEEGRYVELLMFLKDGPKTEQERFYDIYLHFAIGKYDEVSQKIKAYTWETAYFEQEVKWINFLVQVQQGASNHMLEHLIPELSAERQVQANVLMDRI